MTPPSPSSPSRVVELIQRLEAATGPDRELDAVVWLHLPQQGAHAWKHGGDKFAHAKQISGAQFIPLYSASIDAALTLVPEGWVPRIEPRFYDDPDTVVWWANMIHPNWPRYQAVLHGLEEFDAVGFVKHSNMAIALCIAALRALSSTDPETKS